MPESKKCTFCTDKDGCNRYDLKYIMYAGYYCQLDIDKYDEAETEDIIYCPICGKKLKAN